MTITTDEIKDRLDEILTEYLNLDKQIQESLGSLPNFYDSDQYHELTNQKAMLLTVHHKLTDALTAIAQYM